MRGQPGFFGVDARLKDLLAKGDALQRLSRVGNFELFRDNLARALLGQVEGRSPTVRPHVHVRFAALQVKVLILQASQSLSDERTEFLIKSL